MSSGEEGGGKREIPLVPEMHVVPPTPDKETLPLPPSEQSEPLQTEPLPDRSPILSPSEADAEGKPVSDSVLHHSGDHALFRRGLDCGAAVECELECGRRAKETAQSSFTPTISRETAQPQDFHGSCARVRPSPLAHLIPQTARFRLQQKVRLNHLTQNPESGSPRESLFFDYASPIVDRGTGRAMESCLGSGRVE